MRRGIKAKLVIGEIQEKMSKREKPSEFAFVS